MNFNDVVDAMNAEIERQRNVHNPSSSAQQTNSTHPQAYFNHFPGSLSNYRGNNRGRGSRGRGFRGRGRGGFNRGGRGGNRGGFQQNTHQNGQCHYCGKYGHFIKHCRLRIQAEGHGNIRKGQHQNQNNRNIPNHNQFLQQLSANLASLA